MDKSVVTADKKEDALEIPSVNLNSGMQMNDTVSKKVSNSTQEIATATDVKFLSNKNGQHHFKRGSEGHVNTGQLSKNKDTVASKLKAASENVVSSMAESYVTANALVSGQVVTFTEESSAKKGGNAQMIKKVPAVGSTLIASTGHTRQLIDHTEQSDKKLSKVNNTVALDAIVEDEECISQQVKAVALNTEHTDVYLQPKENLSVSNTTVDSNKTGQQISDRVVFEKAINQQNTRPPEEDNEQNSSSQRNKNNFQQKAADEEAVYANNT